jgi:hypothetical protein
MDVNDQFHAHLHTDARTGDVPVLSTQLAPRSVAQSETSPLLCECHIAVDSKQSGRCFQTIGHSLNPQLRHCDSQNLSNAIRWWAKTDIRNVKRAVRTEGHRRREKKS